MHLLFYLCTVVKAYFCSGQSKLRRSSDNFLHEKSIQSSTPTKKISIVLPMPSQQNHSAPRRSSINTHSGNTTKQRKNNFMQRSSSQTSPYGAVQRQSSTLVLQSRPPTSQSREQARRSSAQSLRHPSPRNVHHQQNNRVSTPYGRTQATRKIGVSIIINCFSMNYK